MREMMLHTESTPSHQTTVSQKHEKRIVYCVALTAFVFQFEAFLVSVSLPDMAREMHATSTSISFVVLTYLLAATISFLPAGRLGDRYGLRRIFLTGCALACTGTLASGLSGSLPLLWASRVIQGLGTGAMVATGYAMIPTWVRKDRIGWGYGMLSMGAGLGMLAGMPVGGLLSHYLAWQWIFLATFPIFLCLFWFAAVQLPGLKNEVPAVTNKTSLDWPGLVMCALMISALVLFCSLGTEAGWSSPAMMTLLCTSGLFCLILFLRGRRGKVLLEPDLLRCPGFLLAISTLFLFQFVNGGIRFLMPFYLELGCGLSILMSSALLLAYPLGFAPASIGSGHLTDRLGSRPMVLAALLLGTILCSAYAGLLASREIGFFILFMVLFGLVTAIFSPANNRLTMANVSEMHRGEASALLPVALNLGSVFGVSVFDTIFSLDLSGEAVTALHGSKVSEGTMQYLLEGFEHAFLFASLVLLITTLCALGYPKTIRPAQPIL